MKILTSNRFRKQYKKLPTKIQTRFTERVDDLKNDQRDRSLNLHKVKYAGDAYISMNITGDHRALFVWAEKDMVLFDAIGTHSQLYG